MSFIDKLLNIGTFFLRHYKNDRIGYVMIYCGQSNTIKEVRSRFGLSENLNNIMNRGRNSIERN